MFSRLSPLMSVHLPGFGCKAIHLIFNDYSGFWGTDNNYIEKLQVKFEFKCMYFCFKWIQNYYRYANSVNSKQGWEPIFCMLLQ